MTFLEKRPMTGTPKISIIIPGFNVEDKIGRAIESCLRFSRLDPEIIVINDGSTDGTKERVDSYARNSRIVAVHFERNQGVSRARNHGLRMASGEYVAFLDADDFFLEDADAHMRAAMEQHPELEVYCFGYVINGKNSPQPQSSVLHTEFIRRKFSNTNSIVSRKSALNDFYFDENHRVGEDTLFWFTLLLQKRSLYFDRAVSYYDYRPKINLIHQHPIMGLDLRAMGVAAPDAEEIHSLLKKNIDMKKAFSRTDLFSQSVSKLGLRGAIYWIAGPHSFEKLWNLKSGLKKWANGQ